MKRNKNLVELSKDHHHGLLLGWKIKQGLKRNIAADVITEYACHFADRALLPHFEEEENQVLIYLTSDNEFLIRTLAEHQEIREIIGALRINKVSRLTLLIELADKVEAHIRFEERELFPYLEKVLSEQHLDKIGSLISDLHSPYLEKYPNEFWAS